MTTTIAVKERTAQVLLQLKKKLKTKSLDETIEKLLKRAGEIEESRFGSQKGLKNFYPMTLPKDW